MGISSILSDIKNDRNSNNKNLKDNSPPLPKIDSKEFQKVLDTRRSVRVYTDEEIPEKIVKQQIKNWKINEIKNLIFDIHDMELKSKKNLNNSIYLTTDFILEKVS